VGILENPVAFSKKSPSKVRFHAALRDLSCRGKIIRRILESLASEWHPSKGPSSFAILKKFRQMADLESEWTDTPFRALDYDLSCSVPVLSACLSLFTISVNSPSASPLLTCLRRLRYGATPPTPSDLISSIFPDLTYDLHYFATHSRDLASLQESFTVTLQAIFALTIPSIFHERRPFAFDTPPERNPPPVRGSFGPLIPATDDPSFYGAVTIGHSGKLKLFGRHLERFYKFASGRLVLLDRPPTVSPSNIVLALSVDPAFYNPELPFSAPEIEDGERLVTSHEFVGGAIRRTIAKWGDLSTNPNLLLFPYDPVRYPFPGSITRRFGHSILVIGYGGKRDQMQQLIWHETKTGAGFVPELLPCSEFRRKQWGFETLVEFRCPRVVRVIYDSVALERNERFPSTVPLDSLLHLHPVGPRDRAAVLLVVSGQKRSGCLTNPAAFRIEKAKTQQLIAELQGYLRREGFGDKVLLEWSEAQEKKRDGGTPRAWQRVQDLAKVRGEFWDVEPKVRCLCLTEE
jgi:hypothetical protein